MRRASPPRVVALGCAAFLLLSGSLGCRPDEERSTRDSPAPSSLTAGPDEEETAVVARVREQRITREELDEPLRLKLHDLERAKYRMRERRLLELVREQLRDFGGGAPIPPGEQVLGEAVARGEVEILLRPPPPPRVEVEIASAPVRGNPDAPITLLMFCDFQSSHCARVQPTLRGLQAIYPNHVRFAWRDLPLAFHRDAYRAAEAARCAAEQTAFWEYHDALFLQQDDLARPSLERTARTLELDLESFQECLAAGRSRPAIRADLKRAEHLGLDSVPVFFVNGLYLKGPQPEGAFRALINGELRRLDVEPPPGGGEGTSAARRTMALPRTDLPLTLTGTVVGEDATRSLAVIRIEGKEDAQLFRPGDRVLEGVRLASVTHTGAYLEREGAIEYLPLGSAESPLEKTSQEGSQPAPGPPPEGVLRLRRAAVDRALAARDQLEKLLEPGRLDLEGKRLLKLTRVEPGSLYEMLGLRPRDVILQVDGQWVHDQQNPLWNALETKARVTLLVMRRGFPKSFLYEID